MSDYIAVTPERQPATQEQEHNRGWLMRTVIR